MADQKFTHQGVQYTIDTEGNIRDGAGAFLTGAAASDPALLAAGKQAADDPTARRISELEDQRSTLVAISTSSDPSVGLLQKQAANTAIAKLEPQLSRAYQDSAANERARAKALTTGEKASSPAALLQAAAAESRADAMITRANAYAEGTSDKRAQLDADVKSKEAAARVDGLKADLASATQPDQIAAVHTALQAALQNLDTVKQANVAAGLNNNILAAKAANAPTDAASATRTGVAGAVTAEAGATTAQANAGVAPEVAQATLTKTQADAGKAQVDYQDALANFNALTPEMRTQAAQDALATKRTALETANQQLELAKQLMPLAVGQAGANIDATKASTADKVLGPLAGINEKVAALAAAIRSGAIDDPAKAHQQLQDYLSTALRGTTVYQETKDANDMATTRRGQDSSLAGTQMSTMGSFGSSALGNMLSANKDAPAGSTAMASAYGGVMGAMMGAMNTMRPGQAGVSPAAPPSPLLNSLSTAANTPPPAPAPAASTTIAPDGTVTIAHTPTVAPIGPTPTIPLLGPGQAGTGADPMTGGPQNPAFLGGMGLAMPHHVDALWQNDPNLNLSRVSSFGTGA